MGQKYLDQTKDMVLTRLKVGPVEVALGLEVTDSRTVYTYKEAVAQMIYQCIPDYAKLIEQLIQTFAGRMQPRRGTWVLYI